jgi:hypothetical protein
MWETQSAPSAIATAISVNTRPGECTHGPAYVSANAAVTPAVSPVSRASSRSIPTPACDTTPTPSALTFTRRDRLLRFTREVPFRTRTRTLSKSQFSLRDRHFALSTTRVATIRVKHSG